VHDRRRMHRRRAVDKRLLVIRATHMPQRSRGTRRNGCGQTRVATRLVDNALHADRKQRDGDDANVLWTSTCVEFVDQRAPSVST
ncbi:hypothetical protein, partial [Amycolatopsis magusensis]|uniref:hypothetical protein n=1 Tax=Amycolatopsis magusensis TaxID=882444 RepID=UPI003C2AC29D